MPELNRRPVPSLVILLLLVPWAMGGTAEEPEITDPPGDVELSGGGDLDPLIEASGQDDDFADVDILRAWVEQPDMAVLVFVVESAEAIQEDTGTSLSFAVRPGPDSVANSTADGTAWTLTFTGAEADDAPDGVSAEADGEALRVSVPRSAVGASGGDVLGDLWVERSRSTDDLAPTVAPGQSAVDLAPDEGFGRNITLTRPPVEAAIAVVLHNGSIEEAGETRPFEGLQVETDDPDAVVTFSVEVRNTGTDRDFIALFANTPVSANSSLVRQGFDLAPGGSASTEWSLTLREATGQVDVALRASSDRGAVAAAAASIVVTGTGLPTDQEDGGRQAWQGLEWLTPLVEATGTEGLGDAAEFLWLAVLVLAVVLLLILLLALTGRRRVAYREKPPAPPMAPVPAPAHRADGRNTPLLELEGFKNDPTTFDGGDDVVTTAVVRNNGTQKTHARVALLLDGAVDQETVVALDGGARAQLRFTWSAGYAGQDVQVRVLRAA